MVIVHIKSDDARSLCSQILLRLLLGGAVEIEMSRLRSKNSKICSPFLEG